MRKFVLWNSQYNLLILEFIFRTIRSFFLDQYILYILLISQDTNNDCTDHTLLNFVNDDTELRVYLIFMIHDIYEVIIRNRKYLVSIVFVGIFQHFLFREYLDAHLR